MDRYTDLEETMAVDPDLAPAGPSPAARSSAAPAPATPSPATPSPVSPPRRSPVRRLAATVGLPVVFVVLWSSGYLVGGIGTRAGSPFALLFWRFAVALVVVTGVALVTRAPWPRRPGTWGLLLAIGILLQTVQFGGVYLGLSLGVSAGLASLIVSAAPLVISVLAVPLFAERLRGRQWVGLVLGLLGVAAAVEAELSGVAGVGGVLLVFTGMAGFVAGTLAQKRVAPSVDMRTGLAVQLVASTATTAALAASRGGLALPLTAPALLSVTWLALVNSLGGFALFFFLLRRRAGGAATSYLFLVPPVTALAGVPLLGQPVSVGAFVGLALAAVGVALVTRAGPTGPAAPEPAGSARSAEPAPR